MLKLLGTLLLLSLPAVLWAYGGRLDANGCHHNRKTGDYHCHRSSAALPSIAPHRLDRPSASPTSKSLAPTSPRVTPHTRSLSQPSRSMTIEEQLQESDRRYYNALILPRGYQRQRAELLKQQQQPSLSLVPSPSSGVAPPKESLEEKFRELKQQRENGEITPEEYYEKRAELLNGL